MHPEAERSLCVTPPPPRTRKHANLTHNNGKQLDSFYPNQHWRNTRVGPGRVCPRMGLNPAPEVEDAAINSLKTTVKSG